MSKLVLPLLAVLAACKGDAPAPAKTAPAPAPPPAPPAAGPTTTAPPAKTMDDVMSKIVVVLGEEAKQRPNPGPSVEAVFARLAAAGFTLEQTKQVVAATARARYCASGSVDAVAVAVCEYATPEAAAAGRDHVRAQFAQLDATRIIVVRGATTITVSGRPTAELEARFLPVLDAL